MATFQWSDIHQEVIPSGDGSIKIVYDENAVKASIDNILRTKLGERVMRPEFGTVLPSLLFETMNEQTRIEFINGLKSAFSRWEPRAKILSLDVFFHSNDGSAKVVLKFKIIGLEKEYETSVAI